MKAYAYTHIGIFHADEVFSSAVLMNLGYEVQRIPDCDVERIKAGMLSGDVMFDVGREFDGHRFFDHHQDRSITKSSFGLIWDKFGLEFIRTFDENLSEIESKRIAEFVANEFVGEVDAVDVSASLLQMRGVPAGHVSRVIGSLNASDPADQNSAFVIARMFAEVALGGIVRSAIARQKEMGRIVEIAVSQISDCDRWVYIGKGSRFTIDALADDDRFAELQFVIFSDEFRNDIKLQCLPPSLRARSAQRNPIPVEWLEDKPKGCKFVHQGRWIASFDTVENAINSIALIP